MFEFRRQVIHLILGVVLSTLLYILSKNNYVFLIAFFIFITLYLSKISKTNKNWFIDFFLFFERKKEKKQFPGKGLFYYFLGAFLTRLFFSKQATFLGLMSLAVGDSFSVLIGTNYGKKRLY